METLSRRQARRLALVRGGLLRPELTGLPRRATGRGRRAHRAALAVVERFGYLQLDTVAVAGARSHAIVLASRLAGFDPALGEELLRPGEPLFEYWGHEASWMPLDLYPVFEFRRRGYRRHPRWGAVPAAHPGVAEALVARIRAEGPLRSVDLEGDAGGPWWDHKPAKRVANALWRFGTLAIRERTGFQRSYDLAERVIPEVLRERPLGREESYELLLERALAGHGWAERSTLAATWRLPAGGSGGDGGEGGSSVGDGNAGGENAGGADSEGAVDGGGGDASGGGVAAALARLEERGVAVRCAVDLGGGRRRPGWIRPEDLELAGRLDRLRPRRDRGVLLSPFDPVLWDRRRTALLFAFDQRLEIFKPPAERRWGYYCLPVLAGDRLVARVDLKAERGTARRPGRLRVLSRHFEAADPSGRPPAADTRATAAAVERWAAALGLKIALA